MGNGAVVATITGYNTIKFIPSNTVRGQGLEVFHVATTLNLSKDLINRLYQRFVKTDVYKSSNISTREFIVCHALRPDWVADVLFKDMEGFTDVTYENTLNFLEYMIVIWNFCTANKAVFARMIFNYFHHFKMGRVNGRQKEVLIKEEVVEMIDKIFGKSHEKQFRGSIAFQHDNELHESDYGDITVEDLIALAKKSPALILPIIEAQIYVRSTLCGSHQWRKLAKFREKTYGDSPIQDILPDSFKTSKKASDAEAKKKTAASTGSAESSDCDVNAPPASHADHSVTSVDTHVTHPVTHLNLIRAHTGLGQGPARAAAGGPDLPHHGHVVSHTTPREERRRSAAFLEHGGATGMESGVPPAANHNKKHAKTTDDANDHHLHHHHELCPAAERVHLEHKKRRQSADGIPGVVGAVVVSHEKPEHTVKQEKTEGLHRRPTSSHPPKGPAATNEAAHAECEVADDSHHNDHAVDTSMAGEAQSGTDRKHHHHHHRRRSSDNPSRQETNITEGQTERLSPLPPQPGAHTGISQSVPDAVTISTPLSLIRLQDAPLVGREFQQENSISGHSEDTLTRSHASKLPPLSGMTTSATKGRLSKVGMGAATTSPPAACAATNEVIENAEQITNIIAESRMEFNPNSIADILVSKIDPAVNALHTDIATYSAPLRVRDETTNGRGYVDASQSSSVVGAGVLDSHALRLDSKDYGGTAALLTSETYLVRRRPSLDAIPPSNKASADAQTAQQKALNSQSANALPAVRHHHHHHHHHNDQG
jgi:hypothetical protein